MNILRETGFGDFGTDQLLQGKRVKEQGIQPHGHLGKFIA